MRPGYSAHFNKGSQPAAQRRLSFSSSESGFASANHNTPTRQSLVGFQESQHKLDTNSSSVSSEKYDPNVSQWKNRTPTTVERPVPKQMRPSLPTPITQRSRSYDDDDDDDLLTQASSLTRIVSEGDMFVDSDSEDNAALETVVDFGTVPNNAGVLTIYFSGIYEFRDLLQVYKLTPVATNSNKFEQSIDENGTRTTRHIYVIFMLDVTKRNSETNEFFQNYFPANRSSSLVSHWERLDNDSQETDFPQNIYLRVFLPYIEKGARGSYWCTKSGPNTHEVLFSVWPVVAFDVITFFLHKKAASMEEKRKHDRDARDFVATQTIVLTSMLERVNEHLQKVEDRDSLLQMYYAIAPEFDTHDEVLMRYETQ